MIISEKLQQIAENEQKVFEAGKKAEYDLSWDTVQAMGTREDYSYGFYGSTWTEKIFRPKYKLVPTNLNNGFRNMAVPDFANACDLDTSKCTNLQFAFGSPYIEHIGTIDLSSCTGTNANGLFSGATNLHTIDKIIWNERIASNNVFYNCRNLENVLIEGVIASDLTLNYCLSLSRASIESFIQALSDVTTGKSLTLSWVAVSKAFETSEGANDGSTSAEWATLIGTRPNWTINLV